MLRLKLRQFVLFDLERDLSTFCILPWIHLSIHPDGKVYTCCFSTGSGAIGQINRLSELDAIVNSEEQNKLRKRMIAGQASEKCNYCYTKESLGATSERQRYNKLFADKKDNLLAQTNVDGHLSSFAYLYWDIRFSNTCNFRCRTCSPALSSSWLKDFNKLYPEQKTVSQAGGFIAASAVKDLELHADKVEEIYFAGGEPLIMKEHYDLLEYLIQKGRTNIRLKYSTNLSTLSFSNRSILELWKHFPKILLAVSVDEIEARGEYIRKGFKWDVFLENIRDIKKSLPTVELFLSPTISIFNVMRLPEIHSYFVENKIVQRDQFFINILQSPEYYSIQNLSEDLKVKVEEKYKKYIKNNWSDEMPRDSKWRTDLDFLSVLSLMNAKKPNENMRKQFLDTTRALDKIRDEDFRKIFPELF